MPCVLHKGRWVFLHLYLYLCMVFLAETVRRKDFTEGQQVISICFQCPIPMPSSSFHPRAFRPWSSHNTFTNTTARLWLDPRGLLRPRIPPGSREVRGLYGLAHYCQAQTGGQLGH